MVSKQVEKNIYLRGPYQYQVRLMIGGRRISETFEDLASARVYRDKVKSDAAIDPQKRQVLVDRVRKREAAGATLEALLDRYEAEISVHKKSADTDRVRIQKLKRHRIASVSVYALSRADIRDFINWLQEGDGKRQKGASGSSVRRYASLLSHALKTARKRWGMPVSNVVADVELPPEGKARRRRLEGDEEARLRQELEKMDNKFLLKAWEFAIETACRRSELLDLRWEDVNLDDRVALFRDTKNGTDRLTALPQRAADILRQLEKTRNKNETRVFPVTEHQIRIAWATACDRAGITGLRWHDMRREGASRLFEVHGLDIVEAASITGHKTLQTLKEHYTALQAKKLAQKLK